MKPLTPWRSDPSAPGAARLLDAARPPPPFDAKARARVAARLGVAALPAAAALAPQTRPRTGMSAAAKIAVIALAAGVLGLAATYRSASPPASPPASLPVLPSTAEPPPPAPIPVEAEVAPPVRAVEDLPSAPAEKVTPAAPGHADPLERELALVDGARAAMASRPEQALRLLDTHARAFPAGQLALERDVLRVEALSSLGRRDEAVSLAQSLASRAPRSIQAQRAAKIVGTGP